MRIVVHLISPLMRACRRVIAPSLMGEDMYCAAGKRTRSHCLRCQPHRALCPCADDVALGPPCGGLDAVGRGGLTPRCRQPHTMEERPGLENSGLSGWRWGRVELPHSLRSSADVPRDAPHVIPLLSYQARCMQAEASETRRSQP